MNIFNSFHHMIEKIISQNLLDNYAFYINRIINYCVNSGFIRKFKIF